MILCFSFSNARFIHSDGLLNSSQLEITFDINAEVEKIPNPAADCKLNLLHGTSQHC